MSAEDHAESGPSRVAAAIGEPSRARILYCLLDGKARTSTELAAVADISASTASSHLQRLTNERLTKVVTQGKHRYYSLSTDDVARVLEGLSVIAGVPQKAFVPSTPDRLRHARTCYDHLAGHVAVQLHDRLFALRWLSAAENGAYELTNIGAGALAAIGLDLEDARMQRRKFAYACLDWSERRPHVAGAVGAALLALALRKRWVSEEPDSRALCVTASGKRNLQTVFGVYLHG